ncbi:hypothetical protein EYZ11_007812 [Aspergillus tanneri]|uniref:Uncharacterized protein n=1 Tax=Aspergillus tanneri TaxID=1220188 RepID=A0A4S3JCE3_9EURO|nr:hypothetical protein EYZ11_007812 [Aspergillus tanneri]
MFSKSILSIFTPKSTADPGAVFGGLIFIDYFVMPTYGLRLWPHTFSVGLVMPSVCYVDTLQCNVFGLHVHLEAIKVYFPLV